MVFSNVWAVLDILRTATEPMSGDEIAIALLRSKGIAEPTRDQRRRLWEAVNGGLHNHEGQTVVAVEGRPRRWWVVDRSA